jgi:hypothetical protein
MKIFTREDRAEFQPEAHRKFFDARFLSTFTSPVNLLRAIASHFPVFARSTSSQDIVNGFLG